MRESEDLEEALSMFYGYVTDNDGNPEELLGEWGIIENVAPQQLPEGFIVRLKEFIPETNDPHLYQLLAGDDPYSIDVKAHLDGHFVYLSNHLDAVQLAGLHALRRRWMAGYTPPPAIATVELYLAPMEDDL